MRNVFETSACFLLALWLAEAHPGSATKNQLYRARDELVHQRSRRSLNDCMNSRATRSLNEKAALRRQAWADEIILERMKPLDRIKRDMAAILATNHQSNAQLTSSGNPFTGNSTCLLAQEGEIGPYWVKGELIRSNVGDGQPGVPLYLDFQIIDVNTCQPVPNIYVDIWNCNSTGVYAGVQANGNGNSNDLSNLNNTFGRGLQPTGSDGSTKFTTFFPGHYFGRVNHIHIIAHLNGTVLPNNTLTSGTMPHIGQVFFDQSLINTIEATAPYKTNAASPTTNAQDHVVVAATGTASDPFLNYVMLGNSLSNGILAWVTLGINPSVDNSGASSFQATLTAAGGVENPNAGSGVPGAGCGGPGQGGNNTGGMGGPGGMGGLGGMGDPGGMGGASPNGTGPGGMMGGFDPVNCAQNGTASTIAPAPGASSAATIGTIPGNSAASSGS